MRCHAPANNKSAANAAARKQTIRLVGVRRGAAEVTCVLPACCSCCPLRIMSPGITRAAPASSAGLMHLELARQPTPGKKRVALSIAPKRCRRLFFALNPCVAAPAMPVGIRPAASHQYRGGASPRPTTARMARSGGCGASNTDIVPAALLSMRLVGIDIRDKHCACKLTAF